jgi:hypothetical protein
MIQIGCPCPDKSFQLGDMKVPDEAELGRARRSRRASCERGWRRPAQLALVAGVAQGGGRASAARSSATTRAEREDLADLGDERPNVWPVERP